MSKIDDVMRAWQEDHQKVSWQDLQTLKAENEELRAQLSEKNIEQGVPVAWTTGIKWHPIAHYQSEQVQKLTRKAQPEHGFTIPLYTHPAPQQKPLTDEQINQMWSDAHNDTSTMSLIHVLARAVEAAHNIKG